MVDARGFSQVVFDRQIPKDTGVPAPQVNASDAVKLKEDFLKKYNADIDLDGIPASYQPSYIQATEQYRQKAKEVYSETDPLKRQQGEMMLNTMKNQLLLGKDMSKERFKMGNAYNKWIDKHGNRLSDEEYQKRFAKTQNFITPQEQFKWGEDGALMFGDKTVAERTSENTIWGVPQGPKLGAWERINKRDGFSEQTLGTPQSDGSYVFSKPRASKFFGIERRRGTPEYQDYVVEAIRQDTGQNVSREEAMDMLNDSPEYDSMAESIFLDEAEVNFQYKGGRADSQGGGNFEEVKSSVRTFKKDHTPFNDPENKSRNITLVRGFYPPDNIKTFVTYEDGSVSEGDVVAIFESADGEIYADVISKKQGKDEQGDRFVTKQQSVPLSSQEKARIEQQMGIPSDKGLEDLFPEKTTPQRGEQEPEEEVELSTEEQEALDFILTDPDADVEAVLNDYPNIKGAYEKQK